jgi:hypothetical protein
MKGMNYMKKKDGLNLSIEKYVDISDAREFEDEPEKLVEDITMVANWTCPECHENNTRRINEDYLISEYWNAYADWGVETEYDLRCDNCAHHHTIIIKPIITLEIIDEDPPQQENFEIPDEDDELDIERDTSRLN